MLRNTTNQMSTGPSSNRMPP